MTEDRSPVCGKHAGLVCIIIEYIIELQSNQRGRSILDCTKKGLLEMKSID